LGTRTAEQDALAQRVAMARRKMIVSWPAFGSGCTAGCADAGTATSTWRRARRGVSEHRMPWNVADPSLPALTYAYVLGPIHANTLAVPFDGGFAVVSPPAEPSEEAFTGLEKHGPVRAIVAPNAFHTVGIAPWKARYPDVPVFAPAQSIARVQKQSKVGGIQPVAEMAKGLGDRVEMLDMPHYKTGEVLVRWRTEGGWGWYLTDVIMNLPVAPKGLFGAVFRWTKSGPGFRRNAIAGTFMVKDKRALYAWIVEQAEKTPPTLVINCHGAPVRPSDPAGEIRAALS
jgi:hypothetical protein